MTDLAAFDLVALANKGFDLPLQHPATGELLGVTLNVLGRDGDVYRGIVARQAQIRLADARTRRQTVSLDVDLAEKEAKELLAACIVGWGDVELDGHALPYSAESAAVLVARFPWLREQVDAAVGDRGRLPTPAGVRNAPLPPR